MLQVWYSNRLERLVARLVSVDADARARLGFGALERSAVVLPGEAMGVYLQLQVAQRAGIAARMRHWHIGNFFESLLPEDGSFRLLGADTLQYLIYDALCDADFLSAEALKRPHDYLAAVADDADALVMRRFQLSAHMARLFEEYHLNRPAMVQQWAGGAGLVTRSRAVEGWQRALWLRVFGADGYLAQHFSHTGVRLLRLGELFEKVDVGQLRVPPLVHFFGMDRVGRVFENLLARLGELCEVHIWALNPCEQFWEDVLTDVDEEAALLSSGSGLQMDGGQMTLLNPMVDPTFWQPERFPMPLRLWGRAGRDQMRMLNRLCGHDAQMDFVQTEAPATVLAQIQQDVLTLRNEREHPVEAFQQAERPDESITILACPGVQREVEVVANEIWRLMRADPTLGADQIAIVLGREQAAQYHTQIEVVFRDMYQLPYHIRDMQAHTSGRVFEAVDLLLDLAFSDLKRRDFLRFLTHPNVLARYADVDAQTWIRWCDELHIVHGADHEAHQGTYIARDLYNWDQGLKRLVLGGFMTDGSDSGAEQIFDGGGFEYLPHGFDRTQIQSAAELVRLARALLQDAQRCREEQATLSEWFARIAALIERYLGAAQDADEDDLRLCRATLAQLAKVDLWSQWVAPDHQAPDHHAPDHQDDAADLRGRKVAYRVAREFVRRALGSISGGRGQYLIDGVSVSTMMPARPMPFRAIFCMGFGEAHFPSSDAPDPLDLRREGWQEGDATRRDLDKYAFLQVLLAASERLYVSYVSRDAQTGEPLEPSSVVQDLQRMLAQEYLGEAGAAACVRQHPLRRFDAAYFPQLRAYLAEFGEASETSEVREINAVREIGEVGKSLLFMENFHPEARREAAAWVLRRSLEAHLGRELGAHRLQPPELMELREHPDAQVRQLLGRVLGGYRAPDVRPAGAAAVREVSITLDQLRAFLESPLQASARWRLGMRADEDVDLLGVEDELFEAPYVESLMLLRDVFMRASVDPTLRLASERTGAAGSPFSEIYDARARLMELRAELPTGIFFEQARKKHLQALQIWQENLGHLALPAQLSLARTHFGRASERGPADEVIDSIALEVALPAGLHGAQAVRVEICGSSELLTGEGHTALTPMLRARAKDKDFLRGFLSHVALVAAGRMDEAQPFTHVVLPAESLARSRSLPKFRRSFAPISRSDALDYLRTLAADFLGGLQVHTMPVEAVFEYFKPGNEAPFSDLVARELTAAWGKSSAEYGPVAQVARYGAPPDAEAILARRFGPFFSRMMEP